MIVQIITTLIKGSIDKKQKSAYFSRIVLVTDVFIKMYKRFIYSKNVFDCDMVR